MKFIEPTSAILADYYLILVPHKMVKYCVNTGPYKSDLYLPHA